MNEKVKLQNVSITNFRFLSEILLELSFIYFTLKLQILNKRRLQIGKEIW